MKVLQAIFKVTTLIKKAGDVIKWFELIQKTVIYFEQEYKIIFGVNIDINNNITDYTKNTK